MVVSLVKALRLSLIASLLVAPVLAKDHKKGKSKGKTPSGPGYCICDTYEEPVFGGDTLNQLTETVCQEIYSGETTTNERGTSICPGSFTKGSVLGFTRACVDFGGTGGARCCDGPDGPPETTCETTLGQTIFMCADNEDGPPNNDTTKAACSAVDGTTDPDQSPFYDITCRLTQSGPLQIFEQTQVRIAAPACHDAGSSFVFLANWASTALYTFNTTNIGDGKKNCEPLCKDDCPNEFPSKEDDLIKGCRARCETSCFNDNGEFYKLLGQ